MKILKIENSQGLFLVDDDSYRPLDEITKDDLLRLVDLSLEDDAAYDQYDDVLLKNQAHQIIYKSIFEKLFALSERKEEFKDESERLFQKEHEKYSST